MQFTTKLGENDTGENLLKTNLYAEYYIVQEWIIVKWIDHCRCVIYHSSLVDTHLL